MMFSDAKWNEKRLSEDAAVSLLAHFGYVEATRYEVAVERESIKDSIIPRRVAVALKKLNPWLSDANVAKAIRDVTHPAAASLVEANEQLYTPLTYGVSVQQDRGDGTKSHTVRFIDYETPANNEFMITRQFEVLGAKKRIKPDLVVFVNGIPLAIMECKSPTLGDEWADEAVKQVLRYQEATPEFRDQGAPPFFNTVQIVLGVCMQGALYATVGTPRRFWVEWKVPHPLTVEELGTELGRTPTPQDVALYGLL